MRKKNASKWNYHVIRIVKKRITLKKNIEEIEKHPILFF